MGSALAFISFALASRALGKEGLGEYATALAFGFTFSAIADLGLYSILVREISRPGADEKKITSNIFTLRVASLVFFLSLAPLAGLLFSSYSQNLRVAIAIGALAYFFLGINQVLLGVFQKHFRLEKPAFAELLGRTVQFVLVGYGFWKGEGLFYFLFAAVSGALVNTLFDIYFSRSLVRWRLEIDFGFWRHILIQSFPIGISLVFTLIYFKIDTIFLSVLKGPGEAGVYNVAYKVLESVIFFPAMFVGVIMPALSRAAVARRDDFIRIFQKTFDILVVFAVPLVVGGIAIREGLVSFLGGPGFEGAEEPLFWLLLATGLIFLGSLFGNAVIALDIQRRAIRVYFGGMVLSVTLNLLFIPLFSYTGAAVVTFVTECFVTAGLFFLVWRRVRYIPRIGRIAKCVLAALPLWFALSRLAPLSIFLLIPFGGIVYFGFLYLLGGVTKEDYIFLTKIRT